MDRFRREHAGHELVEGRPDGLTVRRRRDPPGTAVRAEDDRRVRLLKVLVELVMLPAYPTPIFTITGVKENLKSAFVQVVPPSQRDQVNEILEKGKYLEAGSGETVYFWEPRAISFSEDARLAMSLGLSAPAGSGRSEEGGTNREALGAAESVLSSQVQDARVDSSVEEPSRQEFSEGGSQSEAPALLLLPREPEAPLPASARAETDSAPRSEEETVASGARGEAELVRRRPPETESAEEENHLLVSRSWYIEGGPKNMREAINISRILRTFRWRVEPTYTIGVIVDDILSVETANGEIGGDMTKQVEGAGYKFSRVSVEKGRPVAWFKKYAPR